MENVGPRLKEVRNKLGLTLQELAERIDYSAGTLSNAENGNDAPGRRLVLRIVNELGVNEDWLKTGEGEMLLSQPAAQERRVTRSAQSSVLQQINARLKENARSVAVSDPDELEEKVYFFDTATDVEWGMIKQQIEFGYQAVSRGKKPAPLKISNTLPKIIEFPSGHQLRPVLGNIAAGMPQEAIAQTNQWIALPPKEAKETTFVLKVAGDSMIDKGIYHGDLVRMSTKKEPRNGDVVAALVDHETTLKTYVTSPRKPPTLRSENKNFPPEIVPADELVIQAVMLGKVQP